MGGAASQHDNELVLDVLRLSEPAFAVNGAQQIVAWNDGAERLLGLRADEVIGKRCYEALAMTHGSLCVECSNRCGPATPATHTAEMISPASARQILAAAKALIAASHSDHKRVNVTTLAARTRSGQLRLVHLLHDAHAARDAAPVDGAAPHPAPLPLAPQARTIAPLADAGESGSKQRRPALLTQRELEVLRLLGAGHSTDDIARELSITRVTARNHVNKVLDKLGVNSRLQAVVIASQLQLI
jgi:DNA-binding CsgD family transcriptional regulator